MQPPYRVQQTQAVVPANPWMLKPNQDISQFKDRDILERDKNGQQAFHFLFGQRYPSKDTLIIHDYPPFGFEAKGIHRGELREQPTDLTPATENSITVGRNNYWVERHDYDDCAILSLDSNVAIKQKDATQEQKAVREAVIALRKTEFDTIPTALNQFKQIADKLKELSPKKMGKALTAQDSEGKTPVHHLFANNRNSPVYAAMFNQLIEMLQDISSENKEKLLLTRDKDGNNPLHIICRYGTAKELKEFLQALFPEHDEKSQKVIQAAFMQTNSHGLLPLDRALYRQNSQGKLVEAGKNIAIAIHDNYLREGLNSLRLNMHRNGMTTHDLLSSSLELTALGNGEKEEKEKVRDEGGEELINTGIKKKREDKKDDNNEKGKEKETENTAPALNNRNETTFTNILKYIKHNEESFKSKDIHYKTEALYQACLFGSKRSLERICKVLTTAELRQITHHNNEALMRGVGQNKTLSTSEYKNVINQKLCLYQAYDYFVTRNGKSFASKTDYENRLSNFTDLLKALEKGAPLPALSDTQFYKRTHTFLGYQWDGSENYLNFRREIANHPDVLQGQADALLEDFRTFLTREQQKGSKVATDILGRMSTQTSELSTTLTLGALQNQ